MQIFLTVLHVLFCFTLIGVILLQAGRGQGLTGAAFGSGNVQSLFGTRAADFLTKATSVAAICFILTSISLDYIEVQKSKSLMEMPGKGSTLDVEAIKKALEKVKSEAPEAGVTAEQAAETVSAVSDEAPQPE